jgi:hypothetical protein
MGAGGALFPRYFVAHTDPAPVGALHPVNASVLDAFRSRGREVAVLRDLRGDLHLYDGSFDALPTALRADLRGHELAVGGLRTVAADGIWLLDVSAMEQLPDTPGTNDPIYLQGRLSGPWPGTPSVAAGRLAITRADLLAGLVSGEPFAVRTEGGRVLHAALPGGRTEEIALGQAYVLAFALVPFEIQPTDPANDTVVAQLIHDLLGALRADLQAAKAPHWLVKERLPVPSRAALEAALVADGWKIRGQSAVRPLGPGSGLTGFLSMALGIDYDKKILLPKEAPLPTFLALAARMLASFPGFPDERAAALARRIEFPGAPAPVASSPAPIGLTGAIQLPPRPAGERDEWEAMFRRPATSPGLGTRVTPVR